MVDSPGSALSADSVLGVMVKSLPAKASSEPTPVIKDPYSAIGLFAHACMLAVGFRLVGLGEDHRIEASSNSHSESQASARLPVEWDASPIYAFRYTHSQSSMEFLIKVSRLGGKALVYAVALPDDKTASFEIPVRDYTSEGSIQQSAQNPDTSAALKDVFISPGRMVDLSSLFKINIIQKLVPGIRKEGYEETPLTIEQPRRNDEAHPQRRDPPTDDRPDPARPYLFDDPLAAVARRPLPLGDFPPPGFEDEYEINRPPRGYPAYGGGRQPLHIGERDLYPPGFGPHDPLGMGPLRGGGGMHPTFDDPLFGGRGGGQPYDPHAPPGARYDPVGPGDGPPSLRGGLGFPAGQGRRRDEGNPFGGFGGGDII